MQNRCSKKLENHCQNGSQNELKSIKISLLRRPLAIDSVIFGLLERCQNIMFFLVPLWRLKKSKSWPKMRPKGALHATSLHRSSHFWGFWALGAHAREASEKF